MLGIYGQPQMMLPQYAPGQGQDNGQPQPQMQPPQYPPPQAGPFPYPGGMPPQPSPYSVPPSPAYNTGGAAPPGVAPPSPYGPPTPAPFANHPGYLGPPPMPMQQPPQYQHQGGPPPWAHPALRAQHIQNALGGFPQPMPPTPRPGGIGTPPMMPPTPMRTY